MALFIPTFLGLTKVTVKQDAAVSGESATWRCYKHSSSQFTLKKITHSDQDMTGTSGNPQLSNNMSSTFTSVTAVFVYYNHTTNINEPRVICISTNSSNHTWYKAGTSADKWTKDTTNFRGKNPEGPNAVTEADLTNAGAETFTPPGGSTYTIKLDKRPNGTDPIQYRTKDTVTVTQLTATSSFKGYKHEFTSQVTIKTVKIHGNEIGIQPADLAGKRFVFVYYADGDDKLQRPYLICLSRDGTTTGNTWYERKKSGVTYTWSAASGLDSKDPNLINTLAADLYRIKRALTGDQGYPIPVDRNDDLPNEQGTEANVNIHIEKTAIGYDSNGTEKNQESEIEAGNVKVFLKNNNPKNGYTRFTHKVKGATGKYKKMTSPTFKNGNGNLQESNGNEISVAEDVKYVHVYYGTSPTIPLLIAVCTNTAGSSDTFKYYAPRGKPTATNTTWPQVTTLTDKNPDSNTDKNHVIMHLDKLNDQANQQTVIHIEKTPTSGTINDSGSDKISYVTGNDNDPSKRVITVEKKTDTDSNVPTGYVRYKHEPNAPITGTITYKHNGFEMNLNPAPPTTGVTAVYVYYEKDNDPNHEFPLIVCVKFSGSQKYYKRGNEWTDAGITRGPETSGVADDLSPKLGDYIAQYEVKLEKDNTGEGKYKASPQSGTDGEITVTPVGPNGTSYKGFKHDLKATTNKINHMTIHGQIVNVDTLGSGTPISGKQYVYVYFAKTGDTKYEKPYLICLQDSDGTNKAWYKRERETSPSGGYRWTQDDASYKGKDPGNISTFASELGKIKEALNPKDGTPDTGYIKLGSVEIDISQDPEAIYGSWKGK